MNKRREAILQLCIIGGIFSSITLGIGSKIHEDKSKYYNADKFKCEEKVRFEIIKKEQLDNYNNFMKIVEDNKIRIAKEKEDKTILLKKQKQEIELEKIRLKNIETTKQIALENKPINYNPYNLNTYSNLTVKKIQNLLKGTTMSGLGEYFIEAEKEYHVNAMFLVGVVIQESGWNTSERATNGSNNLTGFGVYTSASRGGSFDSKFECIMKTAKLIKNDYLNKDGKYHLGSSIWNINERYSETEKWSRDINSIINTLINKK